MSSASLRKASKSTSINKLLAYVNSLELFQNNLPSKLQIHKENKMLFLIPIGLTLGETLLAAAASAIVGYGAKSAYDHFSDRDEAEFNRGKAHGEQRAKAEHVEKLRRFAQAMETRMADSKTCFDVILAVMTVGYAYAAAHDGTVTNAKRTEIAEFVIGQSQG